MKLQKKPLPKLSTQEEHLVNGMGVLGDRTRFKMFKILLSGKEMCVTEIAESLDISTPAVSQHFRIFELVGFVDRKRYGQKICYTLRSDDQFVKELIRLSK